MTLLELWEQGFSIDYFMGDEKKKEKRQKCCNQLPVYMPITRHGEIKHISACMKCGKVIEL